MKKEWLIELIKINKSKNSIIDVDWKELCDKTGLTDKELKNTVMYLIGAISDNYVNSEYKVKKLENDNKILKSDIDTLKSNRNASDRELINKRLKNGISIANKEQASKEIIIALKDRGMTYEQIASSLKVSRATIWRHLKK